MPRRPRRPRTRSAPARRSRPGAAAEPARDPRQARGPAAQAPANTAPAPHAPAAGTAIYPTAVAPKYAKEPAGSARQHTCLDQYNANKAAGGAGNGGMNWIEKGGGYYSECNKRLKG